MKNVIDLDFAIEDVNGNNLGTWSFNKIPKAREIIQRQILSGNSQEKFYLIYSDEIDLEEMQIIVEEITKVEFRDYSKKHRYEVNKVKSFLGADEIEHEV